jgi:hypothetical protein
MKKVVGGVVVFDNADSPKKYLIQTGTGFITLLQTA